MRWSMLASSWTWEMGLARPVCGSIGGTIGLNGQAPIRCVVNGKALPLCELGLGVVVLEVEDECRQTLGQEVVEDRLHRLRLAAPRLSGDGHMRIAQRLRPGPAGQTRPLVRAR